MHAYSFISFGIITLRLFIALSSCHSKRFLGSFHVTKHQWYIPWPYAQQSDASTLVVRSSLQPTIIEMSRRKFGNQWMLKKQNKYQ